MVISSMFPIYVDFDDVLSDTACAFIEIVQREFGKTVSFEEITSFDLKSSFGLSQKEYEYFFQLAHQPQEILNFKPIKGAIEVLSKWAQQGFEITIVTGRLSSAYDASLQWLSMYKVPYHAFIMADKYGRSNSDKDIALSMTKLSEMKFCLAIEDSLTMARHLSEKMSTPVALFDRPWNRSSDLNEKITRYASWPHIGRKIIPP